MKSLWRRWMVLARKAGNVQARIFLTLFYFSIAAPFGIGIHWSADPLRLRESRGTPRWRSREDRPPDLATLRHQA